MRYEIRIWKDILKMPSIQPQKAANMLESMVDAINAFGGASNNPDILIDKNAGGEDSIKSVAISYITKEVEVVHNARLNVNALLDNNNVATVSKKKVRVIKIDIKGNLYLPLEEDGLTSAAKSIAGNQGDENKLRNTLLLSKWASVLPEEDKNEHFYRGIIISVITKAGDFRVITAKNIYVDSYTENYQEGEFGTFSLSLIQRPDAHVADFKVDGLGYEKLSTLDKIKKGVETAAKVTATAGVVAAGVGAVGKTVTETVEKFTGETAATRWIKYGFDTASSAGNVANSASNVMKNPKDVKTWSTEVTNVNKDVNERIQKGVDTKEAIPLAQMEKLYLSYIQKDPANYEKYLKASDAEKYKMLEDASKSIRDRAKITKEMEEQTRDYYKNENAKNASPDTTSNSTGAGDLSTLISSAAQKKNGDSNAN